jgi:hypothetical protein
VPEELAGMLDAPEPAGCGLLVPALGVGDVLEPGELLLGTVGDVLVVPGVPGALLVCALANPNTANAAIDARDMTTDLVERMGVSSEMRLVAVPSAAGVPCCGKARGCSIARRPNVLCEPTVSRNR